MKLIWCPLHPDADDHIPMSGGCRLNTSLTRTVVVAASHVGTQWWRPLRTAAT